MKQTLPRILILALSIAVLILFVLGGAAPMNADQILKGPSWEHLMGRDSLGRDLFIRSLVGSATTIVVGSIALFLSGLIGVFLGLVSGWFGGWVDVLLQRLTEVITALPAFVFVSIVLFVVSDAFPETFSSAMGSIFMMGVVIGITHWTSLARLSRGLVLRERMQPYVESAQAMGCSTKEVFFRHMMPNLMPALLVGIANQLPQFLIFESFLSFVGLGLKSPLTSWGILLKEGWKSIASHPHVVLGPSIFIVGLLYFFQWAFTHHLNVPDRKSDFL